MADPRQFANQFSTELFLGSTSAFGFDFGFRASHVRLENKGGVPVRFSLRSTVASTDDPALAPGRDQIFEVLGIHGMGAMTTSTTTSTAGQDTLVAISAWGG